MTPVYIGIFLVFVIIVCFSWGSDRRRVLVPLHCLLLVMAGILYFSPSELYLKRYDFGGAVLHFYFRSTPSPESGELVVKISPKSSRYFTDEYVLQRNYYWNGDIEITLLQTDENTVVVSESRRPTKWIINADGTAEKLK